MAEGFNEFLKIIIYLKFYIHTRIYTFIIHPKSRKSSYYLKYFNNAYRINRSFYSENILFTKRNLLDFNGDDPGGFFFGCNFHSFGWNSGLQLFGRG